jgi:Uma2 family endonuclease
VLDPALLSPEVARPIRREEYEKMVELGLFEGERVELLYGVIVRTSPHGPQHDSAIGRLTTLLVPLLLSRAQVRIQSAFAASDASQPEPDVAVVPPADYDDAHPREAWLIIEVAHSSLSTDRTFKAKLYAESGVPEYWIVNLHDGLVEVRSDIVSGAYTRLVSHRKGEIIRMTHFADVAVRVDDILR